MSCFGVPCRLQSSTKIPDKDRRHISRNVVTITINIGRCPWCNGYRRRKWTRRDEFKSRTRMIAFHIALIPLGKVWIQLFSLHVWVNSRRDWVLQPWWGASLGEGKLLILTCKLRLKLTLCHILPERRGWLIGLQ